MPNLYVTVPHRLSQEDALRRIRTLLGEIQVKFAGKISDLHEQWNGNSGTFNFSAMGFLISGTLAVKGSRVEFSYNLPLAATFFRGKLESVIRERARALLI